MAENIPSSVNLDPVDGERVPDYLFIFTEQDKLAAAEFSVSPEEQAELSRQAYILLYPPASSTQLRLRHKRYILQRHAR